MYEKKELDLRFGFPFTLRTVDTVNAAIEVVGPDSLVTAGDLLVVVLGLVESQTLNKFGIDLELVKIKVGEIKKREVQVMSGVNGLAESAERAILCGIDVALRLGDYPALEPPHILLGIPKDPHCFDLEALAESGVARSKMEKIALNMLVDINGELADKEAIKELFKKRPDHKITKDPLVGGIRRLGKMGELKAYRRKQV